MLSLLMLLNFNLFQPISNPPIEIHKIRKQYLSKGIKTITFLIPNSNYNVATNSSVAINYNHAVLIFRTCYPNLSRFTRTFPVYRTYAYTHRSRAGAGILSQKAGAPCLVPRHRSTRKNARGIMRAAGRRQCALHRAPPTLSDDAARLAGRRGGEDAREEGLRERHR